MKLVNKSICRITEAILPFSGLVIPVSAQSPQDATGRAWLYAAGVTILVCLGFAYIFWRKYKKAIEQPHSNIGGTVIQFGPKNEIDWLQTAKAQSNEQQFKYDPKPQQAETGTASSAHAAFADGLTIDTTAFQDRMKMLQYAQLPINSFGDLRPAKYFEPLSVSNAKSLLDAIDQSNEENEADESTRETALKVLAAFRTSNSVEALSQVALYDLSSGLRVKAVNILTDFDHESVFETILLACSEPTREVRAAAARGLFRLSFDRSGAWKRIIETQDEFRMSRAVRAAVEAGIIPKSFDRLVHEDIKIAYEAFTLVALMIKSGENEEIFEALRNHKDERVKFALLHVMKAVKDPSSFAGLIELRQDGRCSREMLDKIHDAVKSLEQIAARSPAFP